jgi:colanic acid biosynthesis glycosyl transferase WcaI
VARRVSHRPTSSGWYGPYARLSNSGGRSWTGGTLRLYRSAARAGVPSRASSGRDRVASRRGARGRAGGTLSLDILRGESLYIQLWSYNYDPEPTGIAPVSRTLAVALHARGHRVEVVAAHPHYPAPVWGKRRFPYREQREGITVLRLPLWVGRASTAERYRQELTFMAAKLACLPALGRPDVAIVVSPSFPALLPAILNHRVRRTPWILWLHDILPDGAAATGLVDEGVVLRLARQLELAAYRNAEQIVVLSRAFKRNLADKGVPAAKVELVYDPATRVPRTTSHGPRRRDPAQELRILSMGNIGHSQGLAPLVRAFEANQSLAGVQARLIITGTGVAAEDTRAEIRSSRVAMVGLLDDAALERELSCATLAFVSQQYDGAEFNIPSKLMNFMAYGLPVLAAVNPAGEVASLVREAGAGWVVDSSRPEAFPAKVVDLLAKPDEISTCARRAREYADRHFSVAGFADRFEAVLKQAVRCPQAEASAYGA